MALLERTQVGKREMLADLIARVDAKNTPVQSMMPKGENISNMLMEWQVDDFEDPNNLRVEDGEDVTSFSSASPNRARIGVYAEKVRDSAQVGDLAENVSNVAGVEGGSELAESIMKKIKRVARSIEIDICGDNETNQEQAGSPYAGRGLGVWIQNGAQTVLPVPAAFRTPTASIDTTAMASITETTVQDVLASIYTQTGVIGEFELPCGPTLRRVFSSGAFMTRVSASTNSSGLVRTYQSQWQGKLSTVVQQYEGDFGRVNIHPTLFNAHANAGGSAAANLRRGYVLPMRLLSMHWKRKPRVKQLEDRGGGPRFLVDGIVGWKVLNPLGLGAFKATT